MPELPDVELYLYALAPRVRHQRLERLRLGNPFVVRSIDPPPAVLEGRTVLDLRRLGKRIVFDFGDELYLGDISGWLMRELQTSQERAAEAKERSRDLDVRPHTAWGYLDFVYFSMVTQMAGGYGDILPQTTSTRMLVAWQLFIGYALLVLVLNVIVS